MFTVPATVVMVDAPLVVKVVPVPTVKAPSTEAVVPAAKETLTVVPSERTVLGFITKSVPVPLFIVNVTAPADCNVTFEVFEMVKLLIVCVGTFVAVVVPLLSNTKISVGCGEILLGVQLAGVVQLATALV